MQQSVITRVRAPSDLSQISMAIVIGNQVFGVPAIELGDAFGFQPLDADLTAIAALTTTSYGCSLLESVSAVALFASIKQAATDTATGVVELATTAEAQAGTDTTRAITAAGLRASTRELLLAARTYYVRTDGSDSNTGLANTSGGAFLTIQKAMNVAASIDFNGFTVTVQLGDGTYTAGFTPPVTVGQSGTSNFIVQGNSGTPANVIINTTSASAVTVGAGVRIRIKDFELRTTTGGDSINNQGGVVEFGNLRFGACAGWHMLCFGGASKMTAISNYTVSGSGAGQIWVRDGGVLNIEFLTVTYSGTPAWSVAGVYATVGGIVQATASTQSGAATGKRFDALRGGQIVTGGAGASFFPGNVAGTGTNFATSPYGSYT